MPHRWIIMAAALATVSAACDQEGFEQVSAERAQRERALEPSASAPSPSGTAEPSAEASASAEPARPTINPRILKTYAVIPESFPNEDNPITEEKIALGRMLYYETRLSKANDISCNSCHDLANYGVDNEPTSPGHEGQRGDRNSPTVYNAGGHIAQFWDGRAADVEEQALGPILNPVEMAMPNERVVLATLLKIPDYVIAFKKAFPKDPQPVSYKNVGNAIGAFERKLVTPSRFDKWLAGQEDALSDDEVRGFDKFIKLGCPTCHAGPAVGGGQFQKLGLVKPYPDQDDLGRFNVTEKEEDKMKFRVPSLRNIDKTYPYFHKGQINELEEVVRLMAWHQLGLETTPEDRTLVVGFLKTLTGDIPSDYIAKPELPK